jgi:hypothetical protein
MPNPAAVYAVLTDEPLNLRFHEIAELTDYQIYSIYLRERDSKGNPKPIPAPAPIYRTVRNKIRERNQFIASCIQSGQTPQQALKQWEIINHVKRN